MQKLIWLLVFSLLIGGCAAPEKAEYRKISPQDAKEMLDTRSDIILLDVRTQEEFDAGHISGAVLLPNTEIAKGAAEALPDKGATILVYCRSGNRSASASRELISMGYTGVIDFGGIIEWPYDIVTE